MFFLCLWNTNGSRSPVEFLLNCFHRFCENPNVCRAIPCSLYLLTIFPVNMLARSCFFLLLVCAMVFCFQVSCKREVKVKRFSHCSVYNHVSQKFPCFGPRTVNGVALYKPLVSLFVLIHFSLLLFQCSL